jgi:PAS domain S-box-containing protein
MKSEEASPVSENHGISSELTAMLRLQKLSTLSVTEGDLGVILCEIVDAAIDVTGADFGSIQFIDPVSSALRIAAQRGFQQWWVDFWNTMPGGQGSCPVSLQRRERVIVENVEESPIFVGAVLEVLLKAGVRGVQSTPLVSRSGKLLGTFSTHYRKPQRPDEGQLRVLDLLARQAADVIEHVQGIAMLRESEERFRSMADGIALMIWVSDPEGNARFINRAYAEFFGITVEDLKSSGWQSLIHPDDVAAYAAEVKACHRDRRFLHSEVRVRRHDGEWRWVESFGQPRFSSTGEFLGMAGCCPDITERKRLEESQRQNGERQAFLLRLSDALRSPADPCAMQSVVCRMLGEHLQANRVTYADIEGKEFITRDSWVKDVSPRVRRGLITVFGNTRIEAFRRGETIWSDDVIADSRFSDAEQENFRAIEIRALVSVGLTMNGQWIGTFGVHSKTPRIWTNAEIELIREVAERRWSAAERARVDEVLREREQRLRLALDASRAGYWMQDARTGHVDWDDRFREIYGLTAGEPASFEAWLGRVHEEDRPQVLELWNQILRTKTYDTFDSTFRIVRPDGTVAWIQSLGQVHRDTEGQVTRLTGLELDITERRRAEEALQARRDEERDRTVQLLLETAPQGILSTDARGVILTANRALEKMFGWELGELTGQSIEQLVPTALQDQHAVHLAAYLKDPQGRLMARIDFVGQRKDGSTFPIEISLNHVATADGGHAIAFVTDISERKKDEEALKQSHAELERRTLQLSRLASQLTLAEQHAREQLAKTLHDGLQQLLFAAAVKLEQVLKGKSEVDQIGLLLRVRADVNQAMEAARTLSVNLFPPMLHIGGLPAALTWLAKRTQEQYSVVVNVTADPRANPEARDVRILLFEVVRELLFNAVKHAHVGRVDVNLALGPADTIQIQVSDEGVGFDPTVAHHHKDRHRGLGLFSIQERFALLGGHLDIQSAPGKGSRFSLTLPRTGPPHLGADGAERRPHNTGLREHLVYDSASDSSKSLRILIADDHAVVRAGLRELFNQRPPLLVVGEAASGFEAISQAIALQPDLILMDVSMPQMNGIEATRHIRGTLPRIRIVGLSTFDDEDTERAMLEAGAEAYFTKNEGANRLLNHLLSLSGQAEGAAQH